MNNQNSNKYIYVFNIKYIDIINNTITRIISDLVRNRSIYKKYKTDIKEKKVSKRVRTISGGK